VKESGRKGNKFNTYMNGPSPQFEIVDLLLDVTFVCVHVGGIRCKVELHPGTTDDEYLQLLHR